MKRSVVPLALLGAALLSLFLPGRLAAQSITLPDKVQIDTPGLVVIRATNLDADDVRWFATNGLQTFPPDVLKPQPGVFCGFALQPGTYKIGALAAKAVGGKAVMSLPSYCTVTVGTPAPGPTPGPGPQPGPGPFDTSGPSGKIAGTYVLMVFDDATKNALPKDQQPILFGTVMRQYLNATCGLGPDSKTHTFRIWEDKQNPEGDDPPWLKAMARPRKSLPWLVVQGPGGWFEGPLPADVAATQAIISRCAGKAQRKAG